MRTTKPVGVEPDVLEEDRRSCCRSCRSPNRSPNPSPCRCRTCRRPCRPSRRPPRRPCRSPWPSARSRRPRARAASTAFCACVSWACAEASWAGSTVGVAAGSRRLAPRLPAVARPEPEPEPVEAGVSPSSTFVRFACAAVSDALSCWSVSSAEVGSTFASTSPFFTLSPGLTSTSVRVPPVVKSSPASLGEASVPEPETVACTVPLVTVAVRAVPAGRLAAAVVVHRRVGTAGAREDHHAEHRVDQDGPAPPWEHLHAAHPGRRRL